jgi:hypothetical protein
MYLVHQSVEGRWKNNWGTREGGKRCYCHLFFRTLKEYGTLRYYIDTCLGV